MPPRSMRPSTRCTRSTRLGSRCRASVPGKAPQAGRGQLRRAGHRLQRGDRGARLGDVPAGGRHRGPAPHRAAQGRGPDPGQARRGLRVERRGPGPPRADALVLRRHQGHRSFRRGDRRGRRRAARPASRPLRESRSCRGPRCRGHRLRADLVRRLRGRRGVRGQPRRQVPLPDGHGLHAHRVRRAAHRHAHGRRGAHRVHHPRELVGSRVRRQDGDVRRHRARDQDAAPA